MKCFYKTKLDYLLADVLQMCLEKSSEADSVFTMCSDVGLTSCLHLEETGLAVRKKSVQKE